MKKVNSDDCLSRSRIHEWFKRFQEGREALEDDERSGLEMFWTKKTREFIRKSLKYMESVLGISAASIYRKFDRKFGVHKGLCQICCAHFKPTRKRPQNFWLFDEKSHCNHQPFTVFAWNGTLRLLLVRKTSFGNERKMLCWRWCYSKGFEG